MKTPYRVTQSMKNLSSLYSKDKNSHKIRNFWFLEYFSCDVIHKLRDFLANNNNKKINLKTVIHNGHRLKKSSL